MKSANGPQIPDITRSFPLNTSNNEGQRSPSFKQLESSGVPQFPTNADGGCKVRREAKSAFMKPQPRPYNRRHRKKAVVKTDQAVDDLLELLVLGKRRRGRQESDFVTYRE